MPIIDALIATANKTPVYIAGSITGTRRGINFVSGATAADNAGADRIDVTISSGAMVLIDDLTVSGSVLATYDTNTRLGGNLPSTYKHLKLVAYLRGDEAGTGNVGRMRFNNDSGASYSYQYINGNNSVVSAAATDAATSFAHPIIYTAASSPSGAFAIVELTISNYNDATNVKCYVGAANARFTSGASNLSMYTAGGTWTPGSPAALSRIAIFPASGNWVIGSRFSLYGIA